MSKVKIDEFEKVVRPIIKYLNDNFHPMMTIIVTPDSAELVEGQMSFTTDDYIKD